MFQARFLKVDEFCFQGLKQIQTDSGINFTSKDFKQVISVREVRLTLAAPYHQEINDQVEVIWRTLRTVVHSTMLYAQIFDKYIHFSLM